MKFASDRPQVVKVERPGSTAPFNGKATTTVTFSEPGDYILNVTANDYSGEGGDGFQCCWTTGKVKVTVQPRPFGRENLDTFPMRINFESSRGGLPT